MLGYVCLHYVKTFEDIELVLICDRFFELGQKLIPLQYQQMRCGEFKRWGIINGEMVQFRFLYDENDARLEYWMISSRP